MSNEVEIVVTAKNNTDAAMTAAAAGQKKVADAAMEHRKASLAAADADAQLQKAQQKVADVSEKVRTGELEGTAAMEKSSTAARDLERASIKVEEAHRKVATTSHELSRAQADLEHALQRTGQEADKSSGLFSKMFSKLRGGSGGLNLGKDLENALVPAAEKAGTDAGSGMFSGLSSAFEGGLSSPVVLIGGILAALAALPVAAAAVSTGMVLAFGAGLAGLGIMFALKGKEIASNLEKELKKTKDPVKREFLSLGIEVTKGLEQATAPMRGVLRQVAATARDVFYELKPALAFAFQEMAPVLKNFIINFGTAFKALIPALGPLTDAFNNLLDAIGPQLPGVFKSLGQALSQLFSTVAKNPDLFAQFVVGMMELGVASVKVIDLLDKLYVAIARMEGLKNPFDVFVSMLTPVLLGFVSLKDAISGTIRFFNDLGNAAIPALAAIGNAALSVLPFFGKIGQAAINLGKWFGKTYKIGLGVIDNATKPISKAVSDAVNFAKRRYQATLHALNQAGSAISSAVGMALKFARGRYQAAMTAINRAGGVISSVVGMANRFARGRYQAALTALNNVWAAFNSAMNLGRQWASKVFSATFNVLKSINPFAHGGIVGGQAFASGGISGGLGVRGYASGGALAMVGEQGPELVRLPTGSMVIPHGQSASMMAQQGAGGAAVRLTFDFTGVDEEFKKFFKKIVRINGGTGSNSVQKAFGPGF